MKMLTMEQHKTNSIKTESNYIRKSHNGYASQLHTKDYNK